MLKYPRPREVASKATFLRGAIFQADLFRGRGAITSVSRKTATGGVCFWGDEKRGYGRT
jgi:hypothetical protein